MIPCLLSLKKNYLSCEDLSLPTNNFVRLNLGYKKNNKLKSYSKRKIIKHCLLNLKMVNNALNMKNYNLMHIKNKEDIDEMVKVYKN